MRVEGDMIHWCVNRLNNQRMWCWWPSWKTYKNYFLTSRQGRRLVWVKWVPNNGFGCRYKPCWCAFQTFWKWRYDRNPHTRCLLVLLSDLGARIKALRHFLVLWFGQVSRAFGRTKYPTQSAALLQISPIAIWLPDLRSTLKMVR